MDKIEIIGQEFYALLQEIGVKVENPKITEIKKLLEICNKQREILGFEKITNCDIILNALKLYAIKSKTKRTINKIARKGIYLNLLTLEPEPLLNSEVSLRVFASLGVEERGGEPKGVEILNKKKQGVSNGGKKRGN
jgi:hypothetical protein